MDELIRLLDDARSEERSESRARQRSLRTVAEESARMVGTLVDLAERGSVVTVRTGSGRTHHGAVRLVAKDFCVLGSEAGDIWLALGTVRTVRPNGSERHASATGSRAAIDLLLLEALARIAPDRPRVTFVLDGGETASGELRAVGVDVVTLALAGDAGGLLYVSASSVCEILRSG